MRRRYPSSSREAADADLLIVVSSGTGALESFLLGSVVAGVLHKSPCPVVVVPVKVRDAVGRIAVGFDGSEASSRALRWAAAEVERRDAELIVIHAWHYPYRSTQGGSERVLGSVALAVTGHAGSPVVVVH